MVLIDSPKFFQNFQVIISKLSVGFISLQIVIELLENAVVFFTRWHRAFEVQLVGTIFNIEQSPVLEKQSIGLPAEWHFRAVGARVDDLPELILLGVNVDPSSASNCLI